MGVVEHLQAFELLPGDVVVLEAGDTRQLFSALTTPNPAYVALDWGDGRHSLVDRSRPYPVLYRAPVSTSTQPKEHAHDDLNPDQPAS